MRTALLLLLSTPSLAATLAVPGDYDTITDALAAAADGDVIEVAAGTWDEALVVDVDVAIVGVDGAETTILTNADTVVTFNDVTASLTGVTVQATGERGLAVLAGVLNLDSVVVTGASSTASGGGMLIASAEVSIVASQFDDNRAPTDNGGHIYIYGGSTLDLEDTSFIGGRGQRGGAIHSLASDITGTGVTFSGNSVRQTDEVSRGGAVRLEGGSLTLEDSIFDTNKAEDGFGGQLSAYQATVELTAVEFVAGEATYYYGGAMALWDSDATCTGCIFTDNQAILSAGEGIGHGGAIIVQGEVGGTSLVLDGCDFTDNVAEQYGGAARIESGAVEIRNSTFLRNSGYFGGALHIATRDDALLEDSELAENTGNHAAAIRWRPDSYESSLTISGTTFRINETTGYGSALYARSGGELTITDSDFLGNNADTGGALMLWDVATVTGTGNLFCGNRAHDNDSGDGGSVLSYLNGAVGGSTWTNNRFVENRGDAWGGGIASTQDGDMTVVNNTFLTDYGTDGGGGLGVRSRTGSLTVTNNLIAWSAAGDGLHIDDPTDAVVTYNDFYGNVENSVGSGLDESSLDSSNLFVDPQLADYTPNGDCSDDRLWLSIDSDLRDAGDPDLTDPDGTRSDIGAYGGPGADPDVFVDEDEDGWPAVEDCDDDDPDTYPGADEIAYDGIDQDCDGADVDDVDGDGFAGGDGGPDCDDDDADVNPDATEIWYDGTDQDCDGNDDDQDLDGYGTNDDCDDLDPAINPGATDVVGDGVDQDCDGADATEGDTDDPGDDPDDKGCGCTTPGRTPLGLFPWLLLVMARRRRN